MTQERKLKVIQGGYGKRLNSTYTFLRARATNTRLMGVVGLVLDWKTPEGELYYEIYHLDFESYGIDGFEQMLNPEKAELEREIEQTTGGLGGIFVEITAKEVRSLLRLAVKVAPECLGEFPKLADVYPDIEKDIDEDILFVDALTKKLTPEIETTYGWIHYFIMRTVGHDWTARRFMWKCKEDNYDYRDLTLAPSTLLRNTVEIEGENLFRVTSLIDGLYGYDLVVTQIKLEQVDEEWKVADVDLIKKMRVSSIEAAMMLKKKEFLSIYSIIDISVEHELDGKFPDMMCNAHEFGNLYSRFMPDNSHVDQDTYYLSGDLMGLYYFTDEEQLVVSSFNEECLARVEDELKFWIQNKALILIGQFVIDAPLLYDFVNSGYGDFFEFLDAEE